MTGPYGQGQVINYLIRLAPLGYTFDILSFEDPEKFEKQGSYIKQLLDENGINWHPQKYHNRFKIVSKIYDKTMLLIRAKQLQKRYDYDMVHCRSYPAAEVGLILKQKFGLKFLFDMRGFWPDEKADGGHWDQSKSIWRKVYQFYKRKEKEFIQKADHIISLTEAGKKEITKWNFYTGVPITVIPCCADVDKFELTSQALKAAARSNLSIPEDALVLSYLGSLGTWYMIDEMLSFFAELKKKEPRAFFLIVTNSDFNIVNSRLSDHAIQKNDVKIINVAFSKVAENMYASDVSISFIKPVYSKMASSPIKIGEILSMGIPIVANNIGDSGLFMKQHNTGILIETITEEAIQKAVSEIKELMLTDPSYIRTVAIKEYSIDKGVESYVDVYKRILN